MWKESSDVLCRLGRILRITSAAHLFISLGRSSGFGGRAEWMSRAVETPRTRVPIESLGDAPPGFYCSLSSSAASRINPAPVKSARKCSFSAILRGGRPGKREHGNYSTFIARSVLIRRDGGQHDYRRVAHVSTPSYALQRRVRTVSEKSVGNERKFNLRPVILRRNGRRCYIYIVPCLFRTRWVISKTENRVQRCRDDRIYTYWITEKSGSRSASEHNTTTKTRLKRDDDANSLASPPSRRHGKHNKTFPKRIQRLCLFE